MNALALLLVLLCQAEPIVIKGGRVVPVGGPEIESGMVLVVDGKIRAVGATVDVPAGAKVIDVARSSWILPGFIDAHSHLGSAYDVEESAESVTPEAKAVEAFATRHPDVRAAVNSGVTLVALSPGNGNLVGGLVGLVRLNGERYDRALWKDAIALKASIGADALRTDREPTSRTGAVAMFREQLNRLPALPIVLHAVTPAEVETALELQAASKRKLILVHARPSDEQLKRLAATKTAVLIEPLTPSDLKSTLELPARLAKAGVPFAFVSDAPSVPEDLLRVGAAFAVKYGLDRETALKALTAAPAEFLGVAAERGSLSEGKAADIVVWNGDPFALNSEAELVLVDGRITWRKAGKP